MFTITNSGSRSQTFNTANTRLCHWITWHPELIASISNPLVILCQILLNVIFSVFHVKRFPHKFLYALLISSIQSGLSYTFICNFSSHGQKNWAVREHIPLHWKINFADVNVACLWNVGPLLKNNMFWIFYFYFLQPFYGTLFGFIENKSTVPNSSSISKQTKWFCM
jgi:hypothetical protein